VEVVVDVAAVVAGAVADAPSAWVVVGATVAGGAVEVVVDGAAVAVAAVEAVEDAAVPPPQAVRTRTNATEAAAPFTSPSTVDSRDEFPVCRVLR
jgi:hypothetical protein